MTAPYGILTTVGWWVPELPPVPPPPDTGQIDSQILTGLVERSDPSVWDTDTLIAEVLDALDTN